jgi:hypothetical protein
MVKFKNYIFLLILGLLLSINGNAQIDKTFWFAAPEVTALHTDNPTQLFVNEIIEINGYLPSGR